MYSNREILIWLNTVGLSNKNIGDLYSIFDNISDIWYTSKRDLESLGILRPNILNKIISQRENSIIENTLVSLKEKNIRIFTIEDEDYPNKLLSIVDKPMVLYSKGTYIDNDFKIAIVGSRKATAYGKWACEKFTKELSKLGITIVSGLAQGVDTIAHKVALSEGAKTIGVLGNGIDIVYPKNNAMLFKELEDDGCLLSEFPLGTQPLSYNFPQRNRIISGVSLGIVVIEAKEKSGSLITAHQGLEQGKDVFALPGNINSIYSAGTNKLIKDGASPLLKTDDILEEIYELRNIVIKNKKESINYSDFSKDEILIIEILKEEPTHSDILAIKTGHSVSVIMSILTGLELKGIIRELSRNVFSLS